MIIFYWLFISGVVVITGSFAMRAAVTGPSGSDVCIADGRKRCFGETAARSIFIISAITLIVNAVHFIFHCSVMTETPLSEVFSILYPFLVKTKYGRFTIVRTVVVAVIMAVSYLTIRKNVKWMTVSGIVFSWVLLVVIAMSGHQGAEGYLNVPFYLDIFHLVAVSTWIGGLFFVRLCFSFFLKSAGMELWNMSKSLINRFSDVATYCVAVAGISGLILSFFNISGTEVLVGTSYGRVLVIKALLVGLILLLGGMNKFFIIPRMNDAGKDEAWPYFFLQRKRLFRLWTVEVFFGLAVLLLTSLLTHLSPEG
jgi:putative copper resistance protein D